jgi:hypothetical protein
MNAERWTINDEWKKTFLAFIADFTAFVIF